MKRYNIHTRRGDILGQVEAPSRRKALAEARARNARGDAKWRFAYRAEFVEVV